VAVKILIFLDYIYFRWNSAYRFYIGATKNWRFGASYDSFVVQQTFVLRMNICGKNRQLLVAANRQAVNKPPFFEISPQKLSLQTAIQSF